MRAAHLERWLVLAQTLKARMTQPSVARPFGEGDLRQKLRLEPHRAFTLRRRHLFEGRARAFERLECLGESRKVACVEAGADLARVVELAILERAEQQ